MFLIHLEIARSNESEIFMSFYFSSFKKKTKNYYLIITSWNSIQSDVMNYNNFAYNRKLLKTIQATIVNRY